MSGGCRGPPRVPLRRAGVFLFLKRDPTVRHVWPGALQVPFRRPGASVQRLPSAGSFGAMTLDFAALSLLISRLDKAISMLARVCNTGP